jgi:hypothetical protein
VAEDRDEGHPTKENEMATEEKELFNGKDMDGWEHVGPGEFVMENGLLKTRGGMGLLWYTREPFGDCVLRVEYMTTAPNTNSGVFIRIDPSGTVDEWYAVHHGYEVQIYDPADEYHRTGAIYSLCPAKATPMNPPNEWNVMEITLDGNQVKIAINGTPVTDFDPTGPVPERKKEWEPERGPRPNHGYIGLQNHDEQQICYFRRVSVRPLG